MKSGASGLVELARLYGVELGYEAMGGGRHRADEQALRLTLRALGAPVDEEGSLRDALRLRRAELSALGVQPVTVAWNGALSKLHLRLKHDEVVNAHVVIRLENGAVITQQCTATPLRSRPRNGWQPTHSLRIGKLIHGYHQLQVETAGATHETHIISAPRHAWAPQDVRAWGVFCPLYALRSDDDCGVGDYTDLRQAAEWIGSLGGGFVSTLPLLSTFLDAPFDPSPYSPVSRLFWNELFLDIRRVPGYSGDACEGDALRSASLVDYRRTAAVRRKSLEQALRDAGDGVREQIRLFAEAHPHALDYARFRAVCDRRRDGWLVWPDRLRDGDIRAGDFAPDDVTYHLFVQWQADEQIAGLAAAHDAGAAALYLDMPLGVHPDGYDAWRFRDLFVPGVSAGAPPDPLFTAGQDWGFRPLNPRALRASGYSYFIQSLRHHLRHARMLRLDHVMSLYRLFWVPYGLGARRGVYVRYPEDELFAVLVLESARHQAVVVGEDLGTVPPAVRRAMDAHHIHRMYVGQFEMAPDNRPVVREPEEPVVASLNTHDMPTFAGFWRGSEIDDQQELGLIDAAGHEEAMQRRAALRAALSREVAGGGTVDPAVARQRILERLSQSPARYLLVNLEDLWLEEQPQNVPGTSTEKPNWRRRTRRSLEEIIRDAGIRRMLRSIGDRRPNSNVVKRADD